MVGRAVDPQPAAHAALVRAGLPRASESSPEASDALKLQEGELFKAFKGSLKTSEAGELRYVAHLTSLKSLNISFSLLFLKDEVLLFLLRLSPAMAQCRLGAPCPVAVVISGPLGSEALLRMAGLQCRVRQRVESS